MEGRVEPEQYRMILESLRNGIYVVDPERRILFWNDGAENITGYLRQEVIGRFCQDNLLMHCDENDQVLCGNGCPLLETIHDGKPREAVVFLRHKEGHRIPVRVRAVVVRNAEGTVVGASESFEECHAASGCGLHSAALKVENHADAGTGVSDRASTESYLRAFLADFAEQGGAFSVLNIRVDELEQFRSAHGPQAVQRILHAVATTLRRNLRDNDVVGHWAEERFLAILADCPPENAPRVARLLQEMVRGSAISWWGDRLSVTISIGSTTVRPGDSADSLVARAADALSGCTGNGDIKII
ncbi:MAG: hypothetical protein C5B51_30065 [Terriglobia bacterium]|nr:MAG: hypothetical protein C5B51_30065 [Terriglobia bacterium]